MSKVLILAEYHPFGGTERYLEQLLAYYAARDHQLRIVVYGKASTPPLKGLPQGAVCQWESVAGRDGWPLGRVWRKFPFSALADVGSTMRHVREFKPDWITVSVGTPGLFLGALAYRRPVLYVLHTYPHGRERFAILARLRRWFLRPRLNKSHRLITVSKAAAEQIAVHWLLGDTAGVIDVVPNGVRDLGASSGDGEAAAGQPLTIVTVGHVVDYKNPLGWIEVARRVLRQNVGIPLKFLWLGDGKLLEECRARVRAEGLEQLKFLGCVDDVRGIVAKGDIYFQPSRLESQGLAVLEAMCAGRPCVVSNAGGLPESVADGTTGLVADASDLDDMAAKLNILVRDGSVRKRMGTAARARWAEWYSDTAWGRRMDALHASVLGELASAGPVYSDPDVMGPERTGSPRR